MKTILFVLGAGLVAFLALAYFGPEHQRFLEFDRQRDAWHRRCDLYIGKPAISPEARACKEELDAMTAYATRQGWNR
jgi:hypothetical protein